MYIPTFLTLKIQGLLKIKMWKISTQKIKFFLVWNLPVSCFWSSPGGVGGGVQQAALPGQGALQTFNIQVSYFVCFLKYALKMVK